MLKILVVDDEPERFAFFDHAVVGTVTRSDNIRMCTNIRDALEYLQREHYDVLIVDMAILATPWAKDTDKRGGIALLTHVQEDDTLNRPGYIIGLTAAEEDEPEVAAFFAGAPWILMRMGASGVDWQTRLLQLLTHALAVRNNEESTQYGVDICIVTALADPEHTAVLATKIEWNADPEYLDSCTTIRKGKITEKDGRQLSVVLACSSRMGSVEAGQLSSKLINALRPKLLLMSGICAGMKDKVNYGDPILANTVWDWTSSKWARDEDGVEKVLPAPHYISCSREIDSRFRQLAQDAGFLTKVRTSWPATKPATALAAHAGPVASGPIVVADGTTLGDIKTKQNRDVLGLEMEAYGVYYAAETAGLPRPWAASIKSVCDFADPRKNDEMQKYAAYTSAAVLHEFLVRFGWELCTLIEQ